MSTPIFILAGQSNASRLADEIEEALDERYGEGNYELIRVHAAGAPITRSRDEQPDWHEETELRDALTTELIAMLDEDEDRVFGGMIWVQGEADSFDAQEAEGYGEELTELIDELREDVATAMDDRDVGLEDAPVTILELADSAPAAEDREGWDTVIDEQRSVAEGDDLVTTVDPDAVAAEAGGSGGALFDDHLHYSDMFGSLIADELVATLNPPEFYEDDGSGGGGADDDPLIPIVDGEEPSGDPGDDADDAEGDDGGSGMGELGWLVALLPILALAGG